MAHLGYWQQAFKKRVMEGQTDALMQNTVGKGQLQRFAIYERNVYEGIYQALKLSFPSAEALVGDSFFRGMCYEYIKATPPEGGCLQEYGVTFPDFVKWFEPAKQLPYLTAILRLDWAIHYARIADLLPAKTPEDMQAVPMEDWENLHFDFQPSMKLVSSSYPLYQIYHACITDDSEAAEKISLDAGSEYMLVGRSKEQGMVVHEISESDHQFINALKHGHSMFEAFERAASHDPSFNLEKNIQELMVMGFVTALGKEKHG